MFQTSWIVFVRSLQIFLALQVVFPHFVFAQVEKNIMPKFALVDSISASPLKGVTMYIFSKSQNKVIASGISGDDGFCYVKDDIFLDTSAVVSFTSVGYKELQLLIKAIKGSAFPLQVKLVSASKILGEVKVISAGRGLTINGNTLEFDVSALPNVKNMITADVLDDLPFIRVDDDKLMLMNDPLVILINGKRHPFYNSLKNLNALPPAAIEQIVIDLVASANYGSKVMNVILKRSYFLGWNGNFNTAVNRLTFNPAAQMSYWQNKFGVDIAGNLFFGNSKINTNSRSDNFVDKLLILQNGKSKSRITSGSIFTSVFYNPDSLSSVDFQYIYAPSKTNLTSENTIRIETILKIEDQTSFRESDNKGNSSSYNLNYTKNFKKRDKQLYFLSQYIHYKSTDAYFLINRKQDSILQNELYTNSSFQKATTLEIGYRNKFKNKLSYKSGGKIINRNNASEIRLSKLAAPTDTIFGLYNYTQMVVSAYSEADFKIKKFVVHLGLRFDHEDFSYLRPIVIKRTYDGLFPNLSLTFNANKYNAIVASYYRSVYRPGLASLVPVSAAENAYVRDSGSVEVKPQYSNNYSLQVYGNYKFGRLGLDASYSSINGFFDDYYVSSSNGGVSRVDVNSESYRSYVLGVSAEIPITRKINFSHFSSGGIINQKGFVLSRKILSGYFSERLNYRINPNQRISMTALAYSPNMTLQGKSQGMAYVKTTISYSYFATLVNKYPIGITATLINPLYINGTPGYVEATDASLYYYQRRETANPIISLQLVITFKGKQFLNKDSRRTESIQNNDLKQ